VTDSDAGDDPFGLAAAIRTIVDFPRPGVWFRDVTTLWADPVASRTAVLALADQATGQQVTKVVGPESRGFIFGGVLAHVLGAGFVPLRKGGKLPGGVVEVAYELEYGSATLAIHAGALGPNDRVLVHDDLLATGGTALAAVELVRRLGATVVGASFVVDLPDLGGARRLEAAGVPVSRLVAFPGH